MGGYEVVSPSCRILFDPFLIGNPGAPTTPEELETPDVIFVSHAVWDHMGDAFVIAKRTGAPIIGAADVRALMLDQGLPSNQVQATIHGIKLRVNGVEAQTVESHHWSQATLSDGTVVPGTALGFIVEVEPGVRIYHSPVMRQWPRIGSRVTLAPEPGQVVVVVDGGRAWIEDP